MAIAMLAACGSSSTVKPLTEMVTPTMANSRVIAFGDALSDAGQMGGTRYTVNDNAAGGSMTLAERLAANFGFTTMTSVQGGILAGGSAYSYAQGGATVATVGQQIDAFVSAGNQLTDNDLVVITAGMQDIVDNATGYYASTITADQAKANMATAATALVAKIYRLTHEAGAKHVVVVAPFSLARTPWGLSKGATYPASLATSDYSFLEQLSISTGADRTASSFGAQLSLNIKGQFPSSSSGLTVLLADISNYFNLMTGTAVGGADVYGRTFAHPTGTINSYLSYATAAGVVLTNPDVPVCTVSITACTTSTIATNSAGPNGLWDYATSVFADSYNLTPAANRMLADYIFNTTMRVGGWR
jgi:hypothetical protein